MLTIVAIMAILKRSHWFLMIAIVAIMAILKITLLTPYAHNCCNYGNSEKSKWILVVAIVAIIAILRHAW